ncbi:MAG: HDOD domain-containing protein [Myxococcales bacterium]|nr:HDOD domain-containing protein [Myxococcales bacterium]
MERPQVDTLAKLQQHLDELPVLPVVLVGLLRADPKSESYFEDVERLVLSDPAFTTRILRYANSAASAPSRPIVRVREALSRLGSAGAVNLILASSAARVFVPRYEWSKALWIHALGVAALARALAPLSRRQPRIDAEVAYVCGLLHDIGRFILYLESPEELHRVDESDWSTPAELIAAERALCGFTHAELGGQAALKWGLPEGLAELILHHHEAPTPSTPAPMARLMELIRAADWLDVSIAKRGGCDALTDSELLELIEKTDAMSGHDVDVALVNVIRRVLREATRLRGVLGL